MSQNLTCGRTTVPRDGFQLMCVNKTDTCDTDSVFGFNCEYCVGGKPAYCTDKDECSEQPGLCGDGVCRNTEGGYECQCREGPCREEGCTDALCGAQSCYQQTNNTVTQAVCGDEQARIKVSENGDLAVLYCDGPLYMKVDAWFLGDERLVRARSNTRNQEIDRTKLKEETLVTCQLKSRWIGKIARHSVLIQPLKSKKIKKSKKTKKSEQTKKSNQKKKDKKKSDKKNESKGKSKRKKSEKSKKRKD